MNIIYAADNRYAPILEVSIFSLCRYNKGLHIIVIDAGISTKHKEKLKNIVCAKEAKIDFVLAKNIKEMFDFQLNMDRGSITQFARLFILDSIPKEWKKVIYLDCDTLIKAPLEEMYQIDMNEMVVAGVEDAFSKQHWSALGLGREDIYINSGMMLIDLYKWEKLKIEVHIKELITQRRGRILQGDQGILNAVLKVKILKLPIRYNMVTYCFDFTYDEMFFYRKPYDFYTKAEVEEGKKNPIIVHFTSSFASMRPWENTAMRHDYGGEWLEYYEEMGYFALNIYKSSYVIYKYIPHRLLLPFIKILHAYIKPLLY